MHIDWKTPPDLFSALDAEFHFECDVCAFPWNAQCGKFYSPTENGLSQRWEGAVWCNPPFDKTRARWLQKAWESAQDGATVVVLMPFTVFADTEWWHRYGLRSSEIRFIRRRPTFVDQDGNKASMRCAVVVFRPGCAGPPIAVSINRDGTKCI